MEYKEHKKLETFDPSQMDALMEFIEFLDSNVECNWVDEGKEPIRTAHDILYAMLDVDNETLELERKHMLNKIK